MTGLLTRLLTLAPALALTLALSLPCPAHAQTDADREQALALLQQGIDAAESGDWEAARTAFTSAYGLVRSTRVLMNLAGAQRHTGHLLEAADSYHQWLADATERDAPFRPTVEQALVELTTDIPQVTIRAEGLLPGDVVRIDGTDVESDVTFQIDPGEHVAEVVRAGTTVASERFTLEVGQRHPVPIAVPAVAPRVEEPVTEPPPPATGSTLVRDRERDDILDSPWLWTGVGGGALLVIGIIIGVAVGSSGGPAPTPDMGTLGPIPL